MCLPTAMIKVSGSEGNSKSVSRLVFLNVTSPEPRSVQPESSTSNTLCRNRCRIGRCSLFISSAAGCLFYKRWSIFGEVLARYRPRVLVCEIISALSQTHSPAHITYVPSRCPAPYQAQFL